MQVYILAFILTSVSCACCVKLLPRPFTCRRHDAFVSTSYTILYIGYRAWFYNIEEDL